MNLTAKQEAFAQLVALQGLKLVDAYRQAYNVRPHTPGSTTYADATALAHHPLVAPRIQALRASLQAEAVTNAAKILQELSKAGSGEAVGPLRWADKVAALDKMAKILGLYRDAEAEAPRQVITHVTVVLDHGEGKRPDKVIEGEISNEKAA